MTSPGLSSVALLFPAPDLPSPAQQPQDDAPLAARVPAGRLVEITAGSSASAQSTATVACIVHAQACGETVAWVQPRGGALYPPDLAVSGVDLDALVIVHAPVAAGPHGCAKATEILLRSGGFGMLVVALRSNAVHEPKLASLSRLFALAREHGSWVLLLTRAGAHLGSLVTLRIEPCRTRTDRGNFALEHHVHKDKTGILTTFPPDLCQGPPGLV